MMDDDVSGDGPETSNRAIRSTGADQFNHHHAEYENRIPQEPDQIQAVLNHNKNHPLMINELNKKKSLADAGMKKREKDCHYCDPNCRACRAIMFFREIPKVAFDPKCRACRKLKAWRENKLVNMKPPCKVAARVKAKRSRAIKTKSNKKFQKVTNRNRHALTIKDSKEIDDPRSKNGRSRVKNQRDMALTESEMDMIEDARCCKQPKKRQRECDSCSTDECRNKKKRNPEKDDSENSSKVSLDSEHKMRNDDSKSSYHDYGELDDEPMA